MAQKLVSTIGRRKTSHARVRITPKKEGDVTKVTVNGKDLAMYFPRAAAQAQIRKAISVTDREGRYDFSVTVAGGGTTGQTGAVVHGIAQALEKVEPELRSPLKKAGLLTRDPREVERKKPGKRKARKSTQFSKR